jgi:hypothetical protein
MTYVSICVNIALSNNNKVDLERERGYEYVSGRSLTFLKDPKRK